MRIVFFVHAVGSCWNNGNAHFLRGIGTELQIRGHEVQFCEPQDSWSETNLLNDHGPNALNGFRRVFPGIRIVKYDPATPNVDGLTDGADLVIVHEWNDPGLVNALGRKRRDGAKFALLFHDTHHRALSEPESIGRFQLGDYDGVLAFGEVLAEIYRRRGWGSRAAVWHEAADTTLFYPRAAGTCDGDVVWVGNWGDEERTAELEEYFLGPVDALALKTNVFGVRYPEHAQHALAERRIAYRGWLANHLVPDVFARHRVTVHVPRRPYAQTLPGIPTIRVFEALACGIPLISAPWEDAENLFPTLCYLKARNGEEMRTHLRTVLADSALARSLRENGLRIIHERHSCRHRVQQLLEFYISIKQSTDPAQRTEAA